MLAHFVIKYDQIWLKDTENVRGIPTGELALVFCSSRWFSQNTIEFS